VEILAVVAALVALVLLGLLVREHQAARAAREQAATEIDDLRAELARAETRHQELEAGRRQLGEEVEAATAARTRAETALAQERQATIERIKQAQRMRQELEQRVAAAQAAANAAEASRVGAEAVRRKAEGERDEALTSSEQALAARDEALAARDDARQALEHAGTGADERVERAEAARAALEHRAVAAEAARVDAEASLARLFAGGTDEAVARALWEAEVERADRAWRASIAPMVLADPPDATAVGVALTTAVAHELERLREEVGVSTELRGSVDVDPEPLVALVALRSAQELVAETARHCNTVDVVLAGDERLHLTVSGDGFDGSPTSLRGIGTLVALVAGEVAVDTGADRSLTTEVRLPLRATTSS
jgi:hypothetical protein